MKKKTLLLLSLLGMSISNHSAYALPPLHSLAGPAAYPSGMLVCWLCLANVGNFSNKGALLSIKKHINLAATWGIFSGVPATLGAALLWCAAYVGPKAPYVISPWGSGVIGFFVGLIQLVGIADDMNDKKKPIWKTVGKAAGYVVLPAVPYSLYIFRQRV